MSCIPGMPCYDENNPPALPEGVCSSDFMGYPIISSLIYYSGQFLPNTGIATNDFLTTALQKIDPQLSPISITEKILNRIQTNPGYNSQICAIIENCAGIITTTTTSTSTTSTSTTSTTSTTTTAVPTTTTTTTVVPGTTTSTTTSTSTSTSTTTSTTTANPTTTTTTTANLTTTTTSTTINPITTTTTSSTTTLPPNQEWYYIYDCSNGNIVTSTNYAQGTFSLNDTVFSPITQRYYYISNISATNPGAPNYFIQAFGGTLCPPTTSTTTTLPPLELTLQVVCDNVGTYKGKVIATWTGGSGNGYQIRAGYGFNYSTYRSMGTTQTLTLTSDTNPYDGTSGLRNTTGGSDIFSVQVIDNNGTGMFNSTTKNTAINCNITTTTSTTSTTTTLAPVNFGGSAGCANGGSNDGAITITSFSGGSGTYEATDVTYATEALALAGTFTDVTSLRTYSNLAAGTYWVALRDKNNTTNKIAKSFTVNTCSTTTTTTLPPITINSSFTCVGLSQDITIDTFAGGDGTTYFASTTTYGDAGSALAGAVTEVTTVPKSRTYSNQSNGTRYVKITSGGLILIKPVGGTCTTTTTTTTLLPVNFGGSAGCADAGATNGAITITSFTGGSGVYDATPANTTYSTEAAALAGSFDNVTTIRTYSSLGIGTYWVALRDRNNTANRTAKSFTVSQCPASINLGGAYCADVACLSPQGNAVVPCGGGYVVNIVNPPAGYTVTMTYSVQGGPDGSYANLLNPSAGVYRVQAWFAASTSTMLITLNLLNSSGGLVTTSTATVSRNSPSNFLGLPSCSPPSNVTLSPQNSLDGNSYTVYINGSEDAAWNSGTRSYPAYTTIRVVYSSPACGVLLNGSAYTSNSTITLLNGTAYTFTLYNANNYVNNGSPYCSGNELRQPTINDCGATSYTVISSCSCSCNQACSGTYTTAAYCSGNQLLQDEYYTCNGAFKQTNTLSTCSCSCNVACSGTYWGSNYCSGNALVRKQYYTCNNAETGVIETISSCSCDCNQACLGTGATDPYCSNSALVRNLYYICNGAYAGTETLDDCSCSCNPGCEGTYETTYCVDTTLYGRLVYFCNGSYVGPPYVKEIDSPTCGYTGLFDVYESCSSPGTYYYVNYISGNTFTATINNQCCSRVAYEWTAALVQANYPSAIFFSTIINDNCPCN